jgi:putative ABC transport system permease protein
MLLNALQLALREIRRNVLRSSLTALGIIIGVAAVIIMVTLGNGATARVTTDIASLGSNLLQVRPGQRAHGPGRTRSTAPALTIEDVAAISEHIAGIEPAAPNATRRTQAIFGNENWSTTITGSTNAYLSVRNWTLASGRAFSSSELHGGKSVCILGSTVRKELFGGQQPIGSTIRLKKLSCQVIGLFESKGQSTFGTDRDDFLLIPLKTFQRRIAGNRDLNSIYISALNGVDTEEVERDITLLMRERRQIKPGAADDFSVRNMKDLVSRVTGVTKVMTALLGAVAGVSLLVGGIGIMNIMLVSVTERTREIGIRMAIGALEQEVLLQFLVEAVVLSSLGGLAGIGLALIVSTLLAELLNIPLVFDLGIVLIAFVFSAVVGVVFGYFPARKAARLDPIDALRHE